ncbi:Predicted kinase, aminoglycoside phosphotransferase (APT) family [Halogranum gelatinilyticum]|uniref:Predicted kinase, aminoglycoside phosphotransferase (APT) family n=1 Tax=Halogranum gelatinilyticum TaxID=660521 RepID=A0A1G9XZB7_9EURY|nr:phosphotransferase [Halogranum gelatinilyticum]SDN02107.1 Predicted kinase, aminoglycoside phosphotransferase (APT) family [Halogranum gelatinilyticum]
MDEDVASALGSAFPSREVDDIGSTGPSWNEKNQTVRVEFVDGGAVYLKLAADGDGSRIRRERAVLDYVSANYQVPTPTVLVSETDTRVPYLVTDPVAGETVSRVWADADDAERAAVARQVGKALASLHSRRFDGHGRVVGGDADGLELDRGLWTDVLNESVAEMRELAPDDRFDGYFETVTDAVETNRSLLDDAPAALLHGDPAGPNSFCVGDDVGFLDWERAHVGDPARDLYRAYDQQFCTLRAAASERITTAFFDGYRERAGGLPDGAEKRRPVYEAVRFLGVVGYFEHWVEFSDEPSDELATWMEGEMERRLAAVR